jgi:hypothetical protein
MAWKLPREALRALSYALEVSPFSTAGIAAGRKGTYDHTAYSHSDRLEFITI